VARDPNRPFEVIADGTRVRAVGTQFNVDRRALRTVVTVIEGSVTVSADAARNDTPAAPASVSAGEQVSVTRSALGKTAHADVAAATAWTQRRLVFERRPLGEVAEEFNRYNRSAIHLDSTSLREQQISGTFEANDPESFVEFIGQIPGVRIERGSDGIHVVDRAR
jgi:transmembrane sensor